MSEETLQRRHRDRNKTHLRINRHYLQREKQTLKINECLQRDKGIYFINKAKLDFF